jgi:hypothetical protein
MTIVPIRAGRRVKKAGTPQAGDVIIRKRPAPPEISFTVAIHGGKDQLSMHTYDAALARASGFAEQSGVDLWYSEGESCQCVAEYRAGSRPLTERPSD